ncbi:hypothetical protein [Methanorbis rubei]|uniref:Uncharacterized protein n=1 Tax=Methanorbis rubei TaxID=3028300 RepID=A0AAE4MHJ0_9EURY|nr:hypothetical protein [Methanocorpusculaceae archaeon Cs1]
MTLQAKDALTQYHFAERLKLDIMMLAHQFLTIPSLKKEEKAGAKRMLINITEALAADSKAAASFTGSEEFGKAADVLYEVISLAESNQFGLASEKAGEAMVPITTAAATAWEVLHSHGLL